MDPIKKKLVSLNVSQIKQVLWKGKEITTGIFKEPVTEKVSVRGVNITGDDQADRSVHGGVNKAIYSYPTEHYPFWKKHFLEKELPYGMFGENLSTQGLLETETHVGDRIKIGTTELIAVQPRMPCYKLGIRFETQNIIKKFYQSNFSGIYFKIAKEGEIQVGDTITIIEKDPLRVSIKDIFDIIRGQGTADQYENAVHAKHLPSGLKIQIQQLLD
ncbi:MAG: hypothetical protein HeimC2_10590 [Candidatus Heimdallarchaeota archaeon LC_2]|nr:MAG: hypothetical protein HeimC2_10590 [Candidatus Heimdallarchaeota archaeon LC_2]